jgi:hypothetical protein
MRVNEPFCRPDKISRGVAASASSTLYLLIIKCLRFRAAQAPIFESFYRFAAPRAQLAFVAQRNRSVEANVNVIQKSAGSDLSAYQANGSCVFQENS